MNSASKRILFFFVHPSKYHLFRNTINYLKKNNYKIDIAIISKDVLEDLVKLEGWEYTNLFPEGRRSKSSSSISILMATLLNFVKTLYRLFRFTSGKKYDLFITDDCLSIIGWIRRVKCLMFIDDDLRVVSENTLIYMFADAIISPVNTDLGRFNRKKIPVKSYKELASLHPAYFRPDINIIKKFNPSLEPYMIIRLVSLTASHDRNKKGLNDQHLRKLIDLLRKNYKIFITSERPLKSEFESYRLSSSPEHIAHILYFAEMYIGDSQTMSSEASLLGTPAIRCNDFVGKVTVMEEKEHLYGILRNFRPDDFENLYATVAEFMNNPDLKKEWRIRRDRMLSGMDDMNICLENIIEQYAS